MNRDKYELAVTSFLMVALLSGALHWLGASAFGQDPLEIRNWHEADWVKHIAKTWNSRGVKTLTEVECNDGTRCDLLTMGTAWEVEWSDNFWEAPAQAWHYHKELKNTDGYRGLQPGVILLMRDDSHKAKLDYEKCARICDDWGIRLIAVKTDKLLP
jgi:hypothetical protein